VSVFVGTGVVVGALVAAGGTGVSVGVAGGALVAVGGTGVAGGAGGAVFAGVAVGAGFVDGGIAVKCIISFRPPPRTVTG
jgi:hypothetical protein